MIAIGPSAVGVFALGGMAFGVFAFGGLAVGLWGYGAIAIGLLLSCGVISVSPGVALGAFAFGGIAIGGMACGIVARGGAAIGMWVPGGNASLSYYTAETVPGMLRQAEVVYWLLNAHWLVDVIYWLLLPIFGLVQVWAYVWEYKRMKKRDPKLVD